MNNASNNGKSTGHGTDKEINIEGEGVASNSTSPFKFGRMFRDSSQHPVILKLSTCRELGESMTSMPEESRGDSDIPAGYTYFGQFVDHDLSMDVTERTSAKTPRREADDPSTPAIEPTPIEVLEQARSPSLDLDSLYGTVSGIDREFIDGAKFIIGRTTPSRAGTGPVEKALPFDLPRKNETRKNPDGSSKTARVAMIGDPRNDENLAVAQVHLMWLKFHNHIVDELKGNNPYYSDGMLFEQARDLVTRHYQYVVLHDFVEKYIQEDVFENIIKKQERKILKQGAGEEAFMPLEFSVAAYRHGHSQVRESYDWNVNFGPNGDIFQSPFELLFEFSELSGNMRGQGPTLPTNWVADFTRLFDFKGIKLPNLKDSKKGTLNLTKALDPYIASALGDLPELRELVQMGLRPFSNLAALNLRRGSMRGLPSGQDISRLLTDVKMLTKTEMNSVLDEAFKEKMERHQLYDRTPLWLYILLEAAVRGKGKRLGEMGSIITAETFLTLVITSRTSIISCSSSWSPADAATQLGAKEPLDTIPKILKWMDDRFPILDPLQDKRLVGIT